MINFTMNNGLEIPAIGYGVFMMSSTEVEQHLPEAIEAGYRHIDTANAYFNEVAVGKVVKESGIAREDFFITSKLFPQSYEYEQCKKDIDALIAEKFNGFVLGVELPAPVVRAAFKAGHNGGIFALGRNDKPHGRVNIVNGLVVFVCKHNRKNIAVFLKFNAEQIKRGF